MVDRGDLVLLDGPAEVLVELLAGEHPEVVGAVAEVLAGRDRLLALLEPVDRHDQRGHHRAQLQRVAPALGLVDVEGGLVALGGADHRHGRAHALHHRLARRREGREQLGDRRRHDAQRLHLGGERLPLGRRREVALEEEVPHVLERQLVGQLDGVVLAVVVEALEAAHVAHRGLGHDHALEPGRRLDGGRVHDGLDLRHVHERPQRHDADDLAVVDHREVAVAVLGELVERLLHGEVGRRAVDRLRHPLADLGVGGRRAGGVEADEVALGEDADRALAVDDDDRALLALGHPLRHLRDALGGLAGDRRGAHHLGDRADGAGRWHAATLPSRWRRREHGDERRRSDNVHPARDTLLMPACRARHHGGATVAA